MLGVCPRFIENGSLRMKLAPTGRNCSQANCRSALLPLCKKNHPGKLESTNVHGPLEISSSKSWRDGAVEHWWLLNLRGESEGKTTGPANLPREKRFINYRY